MTKLLLTSVTACLLTITWASLAQNRPRVVETYGDTSLAVCLAPDGDSLWIGTKGGGVLRVSGGVMERFDSTSGLPGNRVTDCAVQNGTLWVTTDSGLARFEKAKNQFTVAGWGRYLKIAASRNVRLSVKDDGKIQISRGNSTTQRTMEIIPISLAVSGGGRWAVGGLDGDLYLDGERILTPGKGPVRFVDFCNENLRVLFADNGYVEKDGGLTAANHLRGAAALAPGCRHLEGYPFESLEVTEVIGAPGDTTVATDQGVLRDTGKGYEKVDLGGLPCGDRISAVSSFSNALWVGSFDRGLCRLDQDGWVRFSGPEYLPSDMINDMEATADHLYVATRSGITIINRNNDFEIMTSKLCENNLRGKCPFHAAVGGLSVDPTNGTVWIADIGAVHRVGKKGWKHYYRQAGIEAASLTRISVMGSSVAVGTSRKGILLGNKQGGFEPVDDQEGPADNWVMDLRFDSQGGLWVATCTRGVSLLKKGVWSHWTEERGLVDNYTLSVKEVRGRIWVGTLRGLSIIEGETVTNLNVRDGLSGNEVHDVLVHKGKIYLATNGGLTVLEE